MPNTRTRRIAAVAIAAIALFTTPALAATRYVAPWGSDSHDGTADAPWRTIGKANASVFSGDTVAVQSGGYAHFPDPRSEGVTYVASADVVVPGGRLACPRTTLIGFHFSGSVSVWGSHCTLESSRVTGASFGLDNWAGVEGVTVRDCAFDLRNPGSSDFLVRIQPEGDARIRGLTMERCRFRLTTTPGQPVDQKIVMLNRLEDATFRRNLWHFRDSTGDDAGAAVRQGFLVRDGIARCLWDGDTIIAEPLLGGRGNVGIDLTSSGNTIPGGANTWRDMVIEQRTSAYCQFQWKMQQDDLLQRCQVISATGFRISGIEGTARVVGNTFRSTGSAPALTLGGSGNTTGLLFVAFNELQAGTGIAYSLGSNQAINSDWNTFVDSQPGAAVMISGTPGSLADACARGWECHSTTRTSAGAESMSQSVSPGPNR